MNFVGKVSIYRNKATGDVVVLPHVRHPINGAPTEHGPVVRLESLDSGEQLLRRVWKGFAKYREPYREQDEVRRSNAEHLEFNKNHDMVVVTLYEEDSVEVLPFRYDNGQHSADKADAVVLSSRIAKKRLLSAIRDAFKVTRK